MTTSSTTSGRSSTRSRSATRRQVIVAVQHGVVTLTGTMRPEPGDGQDLIPLALRLIWDIDGVVDVVNRLTDSREATSRRPA